MCMLHLYNDFWIITTFLNVLEKSDLELFHSIFHEVYNTIYLVDDR